MVTYPIDHYRKSPMMYESHKEFPPRVNDIDTFPANHLLYLLVMFLIIGVFWREYHKSGLRGCTPAFSSCENMKKEKETTKEEKQSEQDQLRKEHDQPRKEYDQLRKENDQLRRENGKLQNEIDERKAQFKNGWQKTSLYPDWRKEFFQAVDITLDPATAHPSLFLSEGNRQQGGRQLGGLTEASVFQRRLKRREETDTALLIIKPDFCCSVEVDKLLNKHSK
ncbi:hypothetical protein CapIbe_019417 [Capra ibex]